MSKIIFKAGEATVFSEGKDVTAAMPEILIGAVDGPVGAAFANMMAQSKGHTAMFAVRCLLYTSPSPRDRSVSRMPSSA